MSPPRFQRASESGTACARVHRDSLPTERQPTKICRNTGSTAFALFPISELSVGTSRQPSTRLSGARDSRFKKFFASASRRRIPRQANHSDSVLARLRQNDSQFLHFLKKERMRNLQQNSRAIACVDFATFGAAMLQIDENLKRLSDNRIATCARTCRRQSRHRNCRVQIEDRTNPVFQGYRDTCAAFLPKNRPGNRPKFFWNHYFKCLC